MNIFRAIHGLIQNPYKMYIYLNSMGLLHSMPDEKWTKLMWRAKTGKKIDLDNPRGFNEKINWLKLHDRKPQYTMFVDKYEVRKFVSETVGNQYLVPLLGVWDDPDDINFDSLPDEYVLKCNHNSGEGMFICDKKTPFNKKRIVDNMEVALKKNYYLELREWPYKNVKPRIICEAYLKDGSSEDGKNNLISYKFYCFNGEPKFLYTSVYDYESSKKVITRLSYYDMEWNIQPYQMYGYEPIIKQFDKPYNFDEMISVARKLSQNIPFVRIDLYNVNRKVYFSEMTLHPGAGYSFFIPEIWEEQFGEMINLDGVIEKTYTN